MKLDKLEQFALENRDEFDELEPGPELWGNIQADIKPVRRIRMQTVLSRAAAIIIIFTASYFFHDIINKEPSSNTIAVVEEEIDEQGMESAQSLFEAEAFYTTRISNLENEVFQLTSGYPEIKESIVTEFEELDQIFEELKSDLSDQAANQEVVEAMIQNYRIKLQILEDILFELKKTDDDIDNNEAKEYEM